jgi:hypothetical protein
MRLEYKNIKTDHGIDVVQVYHTMRPSQILAMMIAITMIIPPSLKILTISREQTHSNE